MEEYYFVTGVVIRDSTNPFLILLSDSEFRYEIIVCHNAKYDKEKRLFGGNRDLCDLFVDRVTPLRFVDKVEITEDDGYHFPVRTIRREDGDADAKWAREIGVNELDEAVPGKYTPGKIMNFSTTRDSVLNSDVLMGEDRYFSEYCDRRVLIDIKKRLGDAYLKRYTLSAKNAKSVYEILLPVKRENYHLRFGEIDPFRDPAGLEGGLLRFRIKIMKHAYDQACPFGTVSLPGSRELACYGDAKWVYNENRFHHHRERHVILGPIRGRYLCYCRNTGEIKLRGVERKKVARFVKKNSRNGQIVHYRKRKGVIFPGVTLTRIEPSEYDVMITALGYLATRRNSDTFYKNGAVVYGKRYYKPKLGTTTFDYSNFGASCLERLKIAPNLSNVCQWLTKRRVVRPECKREIVRLLGNLKHHDEYAYNVMKTESVNVMLKTLELNEDKSVVSVCTDSVTFDGRVDKIVLPYESFEIKTETRLRPGTCYYHGPSCYFGVNDINDRLVMKGVIFSSI